MSIKILSELTAGTGVYDILMASVEADFAAYNKYVIGLDDLIIETFDDIDVFKAMISYMANKAIIWDNEIKYIRFHGNVQFLMYRKSLSDDPNERN